MKKFFFILLNASILFFVNQVHANENFIFGKAKIIDGDTIIIKGEKKLALYKFHSKIAKHYFCSICGIYTHHNPRINPLMTGFNVGCVDEIDSFKLDDQITLADGRNHPLDKEK